MIFTRRTNAQNADFRRLVLELDMELAIRDGSDHPFYDQFNKIENIQQVILALEDSLSVGCGAFKEYGPAATEIKRMFVPPHKRGEGIARVILSALELWAKELGYEKCILETGKKQPEAIGLYKNCGYTVIPNYGQYEGVENSICFEKLL
jgi:putative acetyltransferase